MTVYKTVSLYGYCLVDEKPPRLDLEALYALIDFSIYYKGCAIIERVDKKEYCGTQRWIVDKSSLTVVN